MPPQGSTELMREGGRGEERGRGRGRERREGELNASVDQSHD